MKKALIGYGGHAREVMVQMKQKLTCFVDDEYLISNTLPLSKFNPEEFEVMIAISDPFVRDKFEKKLPKNTKFFTFIHPTSLLMDTNIEIGYGSFVGAYSILTTNIQIGNHSILNRGNQIGHDCKIGNFFSAMPGSIVSGNVEIGDRVYLGTNSVVREKTKILSDITVGMCSGVIKNINEKGIYVGIPSLKL